MQLRPTIQHWPRIVLAVGMIAAAFAPVQAGTPATQPTPFQVTLRVPPSAGKSYADLNEQGSFFTVTIRNISSLPVILSDSDSLGYCVVSLRITAVNGKTLSKPITSLRVNGIHTWHRNFRERQILQPGEQTERHIPFREMDWGAMYSAVYGPLFARTDRNGLRKLQAVAVLGMANSDKNNYANERSGQTVSAPVTFTVRFPTSQNNVPVLQITSEQNYKKSKL